MKAKVPFCACALLWATACSDTHRAETRACFPGLSDGTVSGVLATAASSEGRSAALFSPKCARTALKVEMAEGDAERTFSSRAAVYDLAGQVDRIDYSRGVVSLKPHPKLSARPDLDDTLIAKFNAGKIIR